MEQSRGRIWRRLIIGGALVLLCVAFVSPGCGPAKPKDKEFSSVLDQSTVVMLDTWVTTQLARQKEWVEEKNGFMEPHVIMRNRGGKTLHLEIRTYFKDANGATLETPTDVWDPVTVNPHEDLHYFRMCPNKSGVSYQFHIRLGKEKHD
jgi:uncharacterized protein YcfL